MSAGSDGLHAHYSEFHSLFTLSSSSCVRFIAILNAVIQGKLRFYYVFRVFIFVFSGMKCTSASVTDIIFLLSIPDSININRIRLMA